MHDSLSLLLIEMSLYGWRLNAYGAKAQLQTNI